ncbi:hypothetical protein DXG01_009150 [Tephrocybe rancida]|nr:hypothetical protein DXG01_009150 [Tephrocybe rancida]
MVGNKADIVQDRAVSKEEGRQLAESLGCEYFETSAKTAMGVDTLFTELVRSLRRAGFTDGHRMEETRTLVREGLRVDVDERHKCCKQVCTTIKTNVAL